MHENYVRNEGPDCQCQSCYIYTKPSSQIYSEFVHAKQDIPELWTL